MKVKRRSVVVEATRWWKNGDHPQDECRTITPVPGDGEPFVSEGKVVRRFRRPDTKDSDFCARCGATLQAHGWLDFPPNGQRVCPGDWIISDSGADQYYTAMKPNTFAETYDPVVAEPPMFNKGHGHIYLRPDGFKADCGGPNMCQVCWQEAGK